MKKILSILALVLLAVNSFGALSITNKPATSITTTSAVFNATIGGTNGTGTNPVATVFYGTVDYTTNANSWAYSNIYGTAAIGNISTNLTGLSAAHKYYFKWRAIEGTSTVWAAGTSNFWTSPIAPTTTPVVVTIPVQSDTNGVLKSPTNFFTANAGLFNATETDPIYTNWANTNTLQAQITANAGYTNEAHTAYGWGNHDGDTFNGANITNIPYAGLSFTDWTGTFDGEEGSAYHAAANLTGSIAGPRMTNAFDGAWDGADDWIGTVSGTAAATIESGAAAGATALQAGATQALIHANGSVVWTGTDNHGTQNITGIGGLLTFADTTPEILPQTTDGSDTALVKIGSGQTSGFDSGGYLELYGNEYTASGGRIVLGSGNGISGEIHMRAITSTANWIMRSDGTIDGRGETWTNATLGSGITYQGNVIDEAYLDPDLATEANVAASTNVVWPDAQIVSTIARDIEVNSATGGCVQVNGTGLIAGLLLTNATTTAGGILNGTNGVFWTKNTTNYWLLFIP